MVKEIIMRHLLSFILVLTLLVMDVVTGITTALLNKDFKSEKMRAGLSNKCKEIGFVLMSYVVDELSGINAIEMPMRVSGIITTYVVVMELASLAENLGYILPDAITKFLPNAKGGKEDV